MAYSVTGDEVRKRLRTLTSVEVDDTYLDSPAYIPACEGFVNTLLANKGYTISSLGTDKKNMAYAAIIALVCARVIASAPLHSFKVGGLIDHKETPAQEKKIMVDIFMDEFYDYMGWIGVPKYDVYFTATISDDYMPDGEDLTNVLMTDDDETTFSKWP